MTNIVWRWWGTRSGGVAHTCALCMVFTILLTFLAKSCNAHMLQVCFIAIWSQGLILNSGRSYAIFGTKIPVFTANSGHLLGTKWQKWWIYKNVNKIVKIVYSASSLMMIDWAWPLGSNENWHRHIERLNFKSIISPGSVWKNYPIVNIG